VPYQPLNNHAGILGMQQSILEVEQDQNALEVLRDTFEQGGWHVTMAHLVQTALQAMKATTSTFCFHGYPLAPLAG
jgi:ActR/RegA family two-component response regulator